MKTEIILFQKNELVAVQNNENIYVAVKPICDAIGLDYISAYKGLQNDEIIGELLSIQTIVAADLKQRDMVCVPIQMLSAWLCGIQIGKVKAEVRPVLVQFKRECANALFSYFFGAAKQIANNIAHRHQIVMEMKDVNKQINILMKRHKELENQRDALDKSNYTQLGLVFEDVIETAEIAKNPFSLN